MFTERKALSIMFEELTEEKRQLKAHYRTDMADIDRRIQQVLDRVQRLDDIEREAVDVEGTLHQLAATTKELAALIPQVDVGDVIEAAAAKMVDVASMENAAQIHSSQPQEQQQEEQLPLAIMPGHKRPKDIMEKIEHILRETPLAMTVREIEKEIKDRYGWQWSNFPTNFSGWRRDFPNSIVREGKLYTVKYEQEAEENERSAAPLQPEVATV